MGAAIHAASLLDQGGDDAFLLDVTPLSLRIGVAGGLTEPVIERNTPVPIEQTPHLHHRLRRLPGVGHDHASTRASRARRARTSCSASSSSPASSAGRRGEVEIDVTFEINTDGIVNVTARDQRTGDSAPRRASRSRRASRRRRSQDHRPRRRGPRAADHASPRPAQAGARTGAEVRGDDEPAAASRAARLPPPRLRTGRRRPRRTARRCQDDDDDALTRAGRRARGLRSRHRARSTSRTARARSARTESDTQPDLEKLRDARRRRRRAGRDAGEGELDLDYQMELAATDTSDLDVDGEAFDEGDSLFDKSGRGSRRTTTGSVRPVQQSCRWRPPRSGARAPHRASSTTTSSSTSRRDAGTGRASAPITRPAHLPSRREPAPRARAARAVARDREARSPRPTPCCATRAGARPTTRPRSRRASVRMQLAEATAEAERRDAVGARRPHRQGRPLFKMAAGATSRAATSRSGAQPPDRAHLRARQRAVQRAARRGAQAR